jgi:hypothetical protein
VPVLLIGGLIAVVARFDLAFEAMTFGSPLLRVIVFMVLAVAGAFAAERAGFKIPLHGAKHPALIGIGAAIAVAAAVALIDGVLFRGSLTPGYVRMFETLSLGNRLSYFMLRAFNENVFYRLFLFSSFAWLFGSLWRDGTGRPRAAAIWLAMIAAQAVNIGINVVIPSLHTVTAMTLFYDTIRYIAPGVFWAYLFSRYGFATAEIASVGCHIFLQPTLGFLL